MPSTEDPVCTKQYVQPVSMLCSILTMIPFAANPQGGSCEYCSGAGIACSLAPTPIGPPKTYVESLEQRLKATQELLRNLSTSAGVDLVGLANRPSTDPSTSQDLQLAKAALQQHAEGSRTRTPAHSTSSGGSPSSLNADGGGSQSRPVVPREYMPPERRIPGVFDGVRSPSQPSVSYVAIMLTLVTHFVFSASLDPRLVQLWAPSSSTITVAGRSCMPIKVSPLWRMYSRMAVGPRASRSLCRRPSWCSNSSTPTSPKSTSSSQSCIGPRSIGISSAARHRRTRHSAPCVSHISASLTARSSPLTCCPRSLHHPRHRRTLGQSPSSHGALVRQGALPGILYRASSRRLRCRGCHPIRLASCHVVGHLPHGCGNERVGVERRRHRQ